MHKGKMYVSFPNEQHSNRTVTIFILKTIHFILTSETHFIFNNEIYDQIDGISMGSLLAPILANLFMGYHEKDWMEKAQVAKSTFYKTYTDNIFGVFQSELDAETFHTYLNTKQRNIKFTYEKQIEYKALGTRATFS